MPSLSSRRGVAAVVVIGDVGRSPRTANHALSLAEEGYEVCLLGYAETSLPPAIAEHRHVSVVALSPPPESVCRRLPELLALVFRFAWTAIALFWTLLFRIGWGLELVLVQNPPALPAMVVAWVCARMRLARFVVDWHNYTWSMLADRWGIDEKELLPREEKKRERKTSRKEDSAPSALPSRKKTPKVKVPKVTMRMRYVRLTHKVEGAIGRLADASICVSRAMAEDMRKRWGIKASVFYDRPPAWKFSSPSLMDRHSLFRRLAAANGGEVYAGAPPPGESIEYTRLTVETRPGFVELRADRPLVVISSTSWTPDEDFSILLDALVKYNEVARISRNSTPASSMPRLLVVITGKGPQKEYYINKMTRIPLEWVDTSFPWLEAADYPTMVASADVGVCLHTSTSGLDLPMKVVDMFGCGLPVLAKKFPTIGELVIEGSNGHLFDTPSELAEQLIRLATGHPEYNKPLLDLRSFVGSSGGKLASWEEQWREHARRPITEELNEVFLRVLADVDEEGMEEAEGESSEEEGDDGKNVDE